MSRINVGLIWGLGLFIISNTALAVIPTGTKLPTITLSGDLGSKTNGEAWTSASIKGKVFALFYVDPDVKEMNEHVEAALMKEKFSGDKYGSIAVVNLDATWIPNRFIEDELERKQKKYPRTIYVKDKKKVLVDKWNVKDDSYATVVFDQLGRVIYSHDGKLSEADVKNLIAKIHQSIRNPAH